ncbi:MAG: Ig-like domain-containing protein [bacterium]|nr:hypothetical protein [Gemmatimonadota bacterium]HIL89129.1 hypothetical protein [Gemmatimonadota bacterium]
MSAALGITLASSCAQQGTPPGGPEDLRPPIVVRTVPDTFELLGTLDGLIRFEFDERISERSSSGTLDNAVIISPRSGELVVRHDSRSLTIELLGGFRPDLVYRVTLLPVVRDLFGNQMRDPFELVFSTGGETIPTTLAGIAWDRITGSGVNDYQVWATSLDDDSIVHVAVTDNQGVYAFRYIPGASYEITAFDDRNADAVLDMMEIQGSRRLLIEDGDTVFLDFPVLQPDTTPATLVTASALDSVTLLLEFDDYLDPALVLETIGLTVTSQDSTVVVVDSILHEHDYLAYVSMVMDSLVALDSLDAVLQAAAMAAEIAAKSDSTITDSIASDVGVSQDDPEISEDIEPVRRRGPPDLEGRSSSPSSRGVGLSSAGGRQASGPDGEPLPAKRIVVLLGNSVLPDITFNVAINGLQNLYGVPLGGGETSFFIEPIGIADTEDVTDSLLVPDTGVVDTAAAEVGTR